MIESASSDLNTVTMVTPAPIERRPPIAPPQREFPESAIRADQAKWTRLIEVLGLSTDQSKAIAATHEETKIAPVEGESLESLNLISPPK